MGTTCAFLDDEEDDFAVTFGIVSLFVRNRSVEMVCLFVSLCLFYFVCFIYFVCFTLFVLLSTKRSGVR